MTSVTKTDLEAVPTKKDWIAPFIAGLLLSLFSLAMSAYASYNRTDKSVEHRVTVVETRQETDGQRLERIENKVDRILDKVK